MHRESNVCTFPHGADGISACMGSGPNSQPRCFPVSIALAATWDTELARAETNAISDEARALYNIGAKGPNGLHGLVYRAPVINISRDPRWGRIQECFGEDPYLTGRMGVAYVQGLQGCDPGQKYLKVAATLKHFAVNNQEAGRLSLSASVPERMLYEYWLPHFKACVVEGHAQSVMAAYNAINGTPCAVNHLLLTDILRGQWGFEGFVVSDLGGIGHLMDGHHLTAKPEEAAAQALLAGCDLDDQQYQKYLPRAVQKGLVSEEVINRALARVLKVAFRLGVFDPPEMVPYSRIPASVINSAEHRALALRVAHESIVLLSNKNNFLPLDRTKIKTVAVIGPAAEHPEYGNYYGAMPRCVSPLQGLKNKLGDAVAIIHIPGCVFVKPMHPEDLEKAVQAAKDADVAIVFLGTNNDVEREDRDRKALGLPGAQEQLMEAVYHANPRTIAVLMNAGPLAVAWAKEHLPAMLEAWYAGEEGGNAIADVLLGDFNPSGKLPYTVYESTEQIPPQTEYDITKGFTYMYFQGRPVFPFGYGLTYAQFIYSNMKLSESRMRAKGKLAISVDVENAGRYEGDEVLQVYVHQVTCSVPQPIKKLVAFGRIHLKPAEKQTMHFDLFAEQLAIYDIKTHGFIVEPGQFEVMAGSSSEDIRIQRQVEIVQPGDH